MKSTMITALLAVVLATSAAANAKSTKLDRTTKTSMSAQLQKSNQVIAFFTRSHRWMIAPRHSSCSTVGWRKTCKAARVTLAQYRTLHREAVLAMRRAAPKPAIPSWLEQAFLCIHSHEGAWDANTGNGYYGGLQMDVAFQGLYGGEFQRRWGTADNWPAWAQVQAAVRAYQSGRGFGPWPNTARMCGLR